MLTEAQKRATKEARRRLVEGGSKRVIVWLKPEDVRNLDALVERHGTPTAAIRQAIKEAAK